MVQDDAKGMSVQENRVIGDCGADCSSLSGANVIDTFFFRQNVCDVFFKF